MNLKPTKPLSGIVELSPLKQRCFDECASRMMRVFRGAGFCHLDLPTLERAEVLTDKDNWDEIETLMYLFQKGDTKQGLRYDGTVGLSRYVSGNINDLVFPFRAYQFAKNFRGERPQRGRYREFYQMDVDIMGINTLSVNYDAEIVATLARAYDSVSEFIGTTKVRVGNRKFWNGMFEYLNLDNDTARRAFTLIDKKDKLGDAFFDALKSGLDANIANEINNVFSNGYRSVLNKNDNLDNAISELDEFVKLLDVMGVKNAEIDLGIMRGHAYYTGIVFEFFLNDFPELGAVGGGGRYEDLTGKFSKTKIVGVGAAVGFSRLMVALMEENRIDLLQFETPIDVVILPMGQDYVPSAMRILKVLRDQGIVAVPYLDADKKFKNQIEFADKIRARFSIIIGEDEVKNECVSVKNMASGTQVSVSIADAIKMVK